MLNCLPFGAWSFVFMDLTSSSVCYNEAVPVEHWQTSDLDLEACKPIPCPFLSVIQTRKKKLLLRYLKGCNITCNLCGPCICWLFPFYIGSLTSWFSCSVSAIHLLFLFLKEKDFTLLTYSSSSQVGHKASISCLHSRRSRARRCASPQERFNSDSSDVIVFLQVVFGIPGFLLEPTWKVEEDF